MILARRCSLVCRRWASSATPLTSKLLHLTSAGSLQHDWDQQRLAISLDALLQRLTEPLTHLPVRGVYIVGPVGCGKTMLLNWFHNELSLAGQSRRVHFHEFMLDVHGRLHRARMAASFAGDPLPAIGRDLVKAHPVLCFDEVCPVTLTPPAFAQTFCQSFRSQMWLMR
jgi:protein AFG1